MKDEIHYIHFIYKNFIHLKYYKHLQLSCFLLTSEKTKPYNYTAVSFDSDVCGGLKFSISLYVTPGKNNNNNTKQQNKECCWSGQKRSCRYKPGAIPSMVGLWSRWGRQRPLQAKKERNSTKNKGITDCFTTVLPLQMWRSSPIQECCRCFQRCVSIDIII